MKRRNFIKTSAACTLGVLTTPQLSFATNETIYSTQELMGKGTIDLVGDGIQLRQEAHDAYIKMKKAAYSAGFDLKCVSSFRSFDRQRAIWNKKYIRFTETNNMAPMDAILKIIEYSTIPGTSRHHWGTEIDVIDAYPKSSGDVLVTEKFEGEGPFAPLKKWLDENSEKFGFYLTYTNDYFRKGFKYEPWHYSYAPLSIPMLEQFRKKNILELIQIEDFEGIEHFTTNFVKGYIHDNILDINKDLL